MTTRPTTTSREHHDAHYDYLGYFETPAFCDLLILRYGPGRRQAVVVFTEQDANTGTSVTNRSEHLATRVVAEFGLDPGRTIFLEHFPERGKTRSLLEMYARLTYTWQAGDGGHATIRATKTRWAYIPLEEAEGLLAQARSSEEEEEEATHAAE